MYCIQFVYFAAVLLVTTAAITEKKMAPLLAANSMTAVKDNYIVVFDENIQEEDVQRHHILLSNMMTYYNNSAVKNQFHIGSFRGYSAIMDDKLLYKVRLMYGVQYVERDQVVNANCTLQEGATWGIVRTTSQNKPSSNEYYYDSSCSGYGVDIYIIDTGIETTHSDFSGRAEWGNDFVDSYSPGTDLHGHGTHCAGTVMADTWGLAKKATAIAVRVLDEYGSGYVSGVVSGINWVVEQHYKKGRRSVANLSLGGGYSYSLNTAVDSAVSNGVHMVVAAGNEMTDACYRSPASAQYCITVAASDSDDDFAYFSNYGTCVDIIAPGVYITSTWLNNNVAILSGTSMSAPHVAGVVAKILSCNDYSPADMKSYVQKIATENIISRCPDGDTPNKLVYKNCNN